jgi:protein tyrosine phosphatase (PTP) superfamily phosphohydrolase (DUF442 family)
MSRKNIRNYRQVDDRIITGGQPTEEQLSAVAADRVKAVINLATIDPRYSLPDEAGTVRALGMSYHHIPVEWENPKESDLYAFEKVMQQLSDQKVLIHCAANFRVTAFYSLYAMKNLGWTEEQADTFRASIWAGSNYPIWEKFIRKMKDMITSKS